MPRTKPATQSPTVAPKKVTKSPSNGRAVTSAPPPAPAPKRATAPQTEETVSVGTGAKGSTSTPAPAPEPAPAPAPSPTASDAFQGRVQALRDLLQQGEEAIAAALRAGKV